MATETTTNSATEGLGQRDFGIADGTASQATNPVAAQTSLQQDYRESNTSHRAFSEQSSAASSWGGRETLQWAGLLLLASFVTAAIAFWGRKRWKGHQVATHQARLVSGQQQPEALSTVKPWLRKALAQGLLIQFGNETDEQSRARIIAGLHVLAANTSEKTGIKVADVVKLSFQDASPLVRQIIVDRLFRDPSPSIGKLFAERRAMEPDSSVRVSITDGLIRGKLPELQAAKTAGDFDRANEVVRELEALGWDSEQAASEIAVLARMQQEVWEQERLAQDEAKRKSAAASAHRAAEALSKRNCDMAEELAMNSLGEDPQNEQARNLLRDLPQFRRDLDEAERARQLSCRKRDAAEHRQQAEKFLTDQEYEAASRELLALRALDPDDVWAAQNLENLAALQETEAKFGSPGSLKQAGSAYPRAASRIGR